VATASAYNRLSTAYAKYAGVKRSTMSLSSRIAEIRRKIKEDEERFKERQLFLKAAYNVATMASERAQRSADYAAGTKALGIDTKLSLTDRLGITSAVPKGPTIGDITQYGDVITPPTEPQVTRTIQDEFMKPSPVPSSMRYATIPTYSTSLAVQLGASKRTGGLLSDILEEQLRRTSKPISGLQ